MQKKSSALVLSNTLDQDVEQTFDQPRLFDERESAIRHEQRSNTVDRRPERLRGFLDSAAIDVSAFDVLPDDGTQAIEARLAGHGPRPLRNLRLTLRNDKGDDIVIRVI